MENGKKRILFSNFIADSFLVEVSTLVEEFAETFHAGYGWDTAEQNINLFIDFGLVDNPGTLPVFEAESLNWNLNLSNVQIQNNYLGGFLMLVNRTTLGRFNTIDHHYYYSMLLAYFRRKLLNQNIDLIVFDSTPHMPTDYALSVAALQLKIPILYPSRTHIQDRINFRNDLRGNAIELDCLKVALDSIDLNDDSAWLTRSKLEALNPESRLIRFGMSTELIKLIHKFMKSFSYVQTISKKLKENYFKNHYFRLSRFQAFRQIMNFTIYNLKIKYFLKRNVVDVTELSGEYVYFPLHYQPERSTLPESLAFTDQLSGIILLRSLLPQDIIICVKEHPKQFRKGDLNFRRMHFRSHFFYNEILRIPGVVLVKGGTDSRTLVRSAKLVVSSTGSAMWEALRLGIPCLSLSSNWHSNFHYSPYIVEVEDPQQYLASALLVESEKVRRDLEKFVENLDPFLVETVDCEFAANFSVIPNGILAENFANVIKVALE
jgi:hypothetical protein